MNIVPTPVTAAMAGVFSAIVWPLLWSKYGGAGASGSIELIVGTLLVIALPVHAFVIGFGRSLSARSMDKPMIQRLAMWFVAALITALLGGALD
jgi:hypothetical protein